MTQCAAANSDSHRTRRVVAALRETHIKTTITDLYFRLTVISLSHSENERSAEKQAA